jgi:tetratricopeptide (TPR) repeat protein
MTRYALVIGIQKYGGSGFKDLQKPVEDAEAIAQILEKHGDFNVERLPKRWIEAEDRYEIAEVVLKGDELGQCIADFFKRVGVNEALIYFSGHGYQVEKMGRKKGYLVASDCTTSNVASNGVGLDDFNSLILDSDLCKCSSLVVLLDCCHAGNLLEKSLISSALSAFNSGNRSYLLATACRSHEEAYEGKEFSLFTAAVLKALRSPEKDGRVRGSLLNHVIEQELRGSGQEPVVIKSGTEITLVTHAASSQELQKAFKKQSLADIPFVLPVLDVSTFTGREKELQQLENVLLNSQGSRACSIVGLAGGGGIGKSALACHFATIHKDDFPDGVIGLRVDGKDVDTIAREFVRRCGEDLDSEDERDAATLMQEFFAHRRMLLIFDNADDASIKKLRPSGGRCAVIITTRIRTLASSLDISDEGAINLDPLSLDDALTLLKKILGDERIDAELASAYEIIRLVGNLPLALQIVGAALRERPRSLADYGNSLQQEKNRLNRLQVRGDSDLNVETSLNLSLELLSKEEKDFFVCLSVCAEDGFARQTAMAATGCSDEWETDDNLTKLYELSLLNHTKTGEYRFVLHPLVRIYAKKLAIESDVFTSAQERHANFFVERLQTDNLEDSAVVAEFAADLDDVLLAAEWVLNQQGGSAQGKKKRYKFAAKLQPLFEKYGHWQKAITLMARFQIWAEQFQDWSTLAKFKLHEARYWSYTGNFESAIDVLQSARTSLHNIESPDMRREREATLLNVLAGLFQRQGRTEEAIQTFRDEILIEEEIGNNRALAIAYNRLGRLLQSERKLEEAEQVFLRQIAISENLNNQASISIGLNCLGGVLQQQWKLEEAEQVFLRQIAISENLNDQASLAIGLNRLGRLFQQQGKVEEAEQVFLRQIVIAENLNNQASLSIGLNCLGGVLQQQGKLEGAEQVLQRGTTISENLNDQASLAIGLNRLGRLLQQQGKLEEAEQAFLRQIAIAETLNDRAQLSIGLNSLGGVLQQQGKLEDLQKYISEKIKISEALNNQLELIFWLHKFIACLRQQKKFDEAQKFLEDVIFLSEINNFQTQLVNGLYQLSSLLSQQEKFEEAQKKLEYGISI